MKTSDFIRREWIYWLFLIIPFAVIPFYWSALPDQVPMHWNFKGEIDSYYPKNIGIFILPAFNVLIYLILLAVPRIDARRENYKLFRKAYNVIRFILMVFLTAMFFIILYSSLGHQPDVGKLVIYLSIILFMILGNYLANLRSNFFIGIRTPWTLSNDEVWRKTHRLAAKIWAPLSLVMLILGLFLNEMVFQIIFIVYISILILVPVIYSYIIYNRIAKS